MRRISVPLILCFLFLSVGLTGQVNKYGNPFIRNYDPMEYRASEQNWSAIQDHRGVMYFGNGDRGILEYDGQYWRSIPVPNNRVLSLAINDQGTIFVGGIGELGYLAPDKSGMMRYNSLIHLIDPENSDVSAIYKTYARDETVLFATLSRLYIYEDDTITTLRHRPDVSAYFSFLIDDELFWGTYAGGLYKMEGDSFTLVPGGDYFIQKSIPIIMPYDNDHLLIGTRSNGLYLYNKNSGEISNELFSDEVQNFSKQFFVYNGTPLKDGFFAFTTENGGAFVMDDRGNLSHIFSMETGLNDDQITSAYNNHLDGKESPLWLTMLNKGIASVECHNPLRSFGEEDGLRGLILDAVRFNETLFVGTMSGLFYLDFRENGLPVFVQIDEIMANVFSLQIADIPGLGERLIIGTNDGVYELDRSLRLKSITDNFEAKSHNCQEVLVSEFYPGRVYLGLIDNVEYLEYKNNRWEYTPFEVKVSVQSIKEDSSGNLWLGTSINGIVNVILSENDTLIRFYDSGSGLPEGLTDLFVQRYGEEMIFKTSMGIYLFDEVNQRFYPDDRFAEVVERPGSGITKFQQDDEGVIYLSVRAEDERWISTARRNENGIFIFDPVPFRPLPSLQCDVIYPDGNIIWFGISNRLYSFIKDIKRDYQQPFNALIRKVTISQIDSVLFNGTYFRTSDNGRFLVSDRQPDELKPNLKFAYNRLEFEFASPFFDSQDKTEFSWFLEGEDMIWSNWTSETRAQYTYLREGAHTLRVRARNVYGVESSEAVYEFYISPPWHRTTLARISYLILLTLFIYAIVVFNSRRLKREKVILEGIVKERTAEVVKQKDELEKQRDKIAEQNKNITDSIEYAQRIQSAILPPDDYVKELLPERFILFLPRDIVSGDFYWISSKNGRIISVAADCTGHGVPGGFMSMLGVAFLNEIVNKSPDNVKASDILDELREQVINSLHQTGKTGESQDGMDISLFILDWKNKKIEFAGANNPLIVIRNSDIIEIKGDKMPIGIHMRADEPFSNHVVDLKKNDVVYSFSDGFHDQFGGVDGKKFMTKNFKQLLLKIHDKPMDEQRNILEDTLVEWQGSYERVDDILVIGVRI